MYLNILLLLKDSKIVTIDIFISNILNYFILIYSDYLVQEIFLYY